MSVPPAALPPVNPIEAECIMRYLSGDSLRKIAQAMGLSFATVRQYLNKPLVKQHIRHQLDELTLRVFDFKMRAFEAAEDGLETLANLSQHAGTEELRRLSSLDCVKISGLMPRKRVLLEAHHNHGIDDDTREWFESVGKEVSGFVDDDS